MKINATLDGANTDNDPNDFFMSINFKVLKSLVQLTGACGQCQSRVLDLAEIKDGRRGNSIQLNVSCIACDWWYHTFYTSPTFTMSKEEKRGRKSYEVNVRSVIAFREFGRRYEAMNIFNTIFLIR